MARSYRWCRRGFRKRLLSNSPPSSSQARREGWRGQHARRDVLRPNRGTFRSGHPRPPSAFPRPWRIRRRGRREPSLLPSPPPRRADAAWSSKSDANRRPPLHKYPVFAAASIGQVSQDRGFQRAAPLPAMFHGGFAGSSRQRHHVRRQTQLANSDHVTSVAPTGGRGCRANQSVGRRGEKCASRTNSRLGFFTWARRWLCRAAA